MADPAHAPLSPASHAEDGVDGASQWASISQQYRAPLRGFFAKRVRDPAEVDDLVQEVFLHLVRRARGAPIEHVKQYVFQVAANALRDWGRRRQVREQDAHESFDEDIHRSVTEISPERVLLGREALARVVQVLHRLPERTRDVFVLRALERRKYAEVASMLCISIRSAEKHMARALVQLADCVHGDSTPGGEDGGR